MHSQHSVGTVVVRRSRRNGGCVRAQTTTAALVADHSQPPPCQPDPAVGPRAALCLLAAATIAGPLAIDHSAAADQRQPRLLPRPGPRLSWPRPPSSRCGQAMRSLRRTPQPAIGHRRPRARRQHVPAPCGLGPRRRPADDSPARRARPAGHPLGRITPSLASASTARGSPRGPGRSRRAAPASVRQPDPDDPPTDPDLSPADIVWYPGHVMMSMGSTARWSTPATTGPMCG